MASSRIFVNGLPPNISEADFKKHFSGLGQLTDVKLIPNRRIGFVGYGTPEQAHKAVKHFNKTYIRMSRLRVELATPVQDSKNVKRSSGADNENIKQGPAQAGGSMHQDPEDENPRLAEFLEVSRSRSKKRAREGEVQDTAGGVDSGQEIDPVTNLAEQQSDEEYEDVPRKAKRAKQAPNPSSSDNEEMRQESEDFTNRVEIVSEPTAAYTARKDSAAVSDADWARSRTSRLLGLLDEDEEHNDASLHEDFANRPTASPTGDRDLDKTKTDKQQAAESHNSMPTPPSDKGEDGGHNADIEKVRSTMRLFVRNLPYNVKEEDLEAAFESYGNLEEVHIPLIKETGATKGIAFIQFSDPDAAESAMQEKDGETFQGRLLHVIPASAKRESRLDDFALSKLPLKKQELIKKRREAGSKDFNWNSLYMNPDAVVSSIAGRFGLAKSEVLDPTSSDAAVKQAHAETHIIQETKSYFEQHGVDLNAFKKKQRGDTAILIKNIPYDSKDELRRRFEEHGELKRFLMPPSGTIAIIEFANSAQGEAAFGALNHRRFKSSTLHLEKAPKGLFNAAMHSAAAKDGLSGAVKSSASELKDAEYGVPSTVGRATLHVSNLSFNTTTQGLTETFKPLAGFLSAVVKTRTEPKRPGEVLSMGYGFLEFRTSQQAQAAVQTMSAYELDGHKLEIKVSRKGADAAEERRRVDAEKRAGGKKTKIAIKNLPFEATIKDVRSLFGAYGQLRSVRVPQKMDRSLRGFGFAEFTTPKEAENAMNALRDTHLLGRKLVLDFADQDPEDAEAEIKKMEKKVRGQVNKVALQKLTSSGRKKFSTQVEEEPE